MIFDAKKGKGKAALIGTASVVCTLAGYSLAKAIIKAVKKKDEKLFDDVDESEGFVDGFSGTSGFCGRAHNGKATGMELSRLGMNARMGMGMGTVPRFMPGMNTRFGMARFTPTGYRPFSYGLCGTFGGGLNNGFGCGLNNGFGCGLGSNFGGGLGAPVNSGKHHSCIEGWSESVINELREFNSKKIDDASLAKLTLRDLMKARDEAVKVFDRCKDEIDWLSTSGVDTAEIEKEVNEVDAYIAELSSRIEMLVH